VQWIALNQFDVPMLKVVLNSFRRGFSAENSMALLFLDGYRVGLVGVKQADIQSSRLLQAWREMPPVLAGDATGDEGMWTWLGRYWGEIPQFADEVRLQDEWAPVIEFSLPRVRYTGGSDPSSMWRWMLSWREGAEQAAAVLHIEKNDFMTFKRAWAATALNVRLWQAELGGNEAQAMKWAQLAHKANADDRWAAFAMADRMFASLEQGDPQGLDRRQALQRILALMPDHEASLRAMWQLELQLGNNESAKQWRQRLAELSPLAFDVRQR
jgi:spermidine synthase